MVISETGIRTLYTLQFERQKNIENFITSFIVNFEDENFEGIIDNENNIITLQIPLNTESTVTVPVVEASENATFYPESNSTVDLSNASYVVTSESGENRFYSVVVEKVKSSNNLISSFAININNQLFYGVIDNDLSEIRLEIPQSNNISNIFPQIEYHKHANIYPLETDPQNFDEAIVYSVIAENGDVKD